MFLALQFHHKLERNKPKFRDLKRIKILVLTSSFVYRKKIVNSDFFLNFNTQI